MGKSESKIVLHYSSKMLVYAEILHYDTVILILDIMRKKILTYGGSSRTDAIIINSILRYFDFDQKAFRENDIIRIRDVSGKAVRRRSLESVWNSMSASDIKKVKPLSYYYFYKHNKSHWVKYYRRKKGKSK